MDTKRTHLKATLISLLLLYFLSSSVCALSEDTNPKNEGNNKGYRILLVTQCAPSHAHAMSVIGETLISRGHEVYLVLARGAKNWERYERQGIHVLHYDHPEDQLILMTPRFEKFMSESVFNEKWNWISGVADKTFKAIHDECYNMMADEKFLKTLDDLQFDLALVDTIPMDNCHFMIPYHIGVPYIAIGGFLLPWPARVPVLPSVTPNYLNFIDLTDEMNFFQRLANLFITYGLQSGVKLDNALLHKYHPEVSSMNDLYERSEFFIKLVDYHLEWPEASMPNFIYLPGITLEPAKPLPENIKAIADNAKEGVVILSFGSYAGYMPENILRKFLQAFAELDLTIFVRVAKIPKGLESEVSSNTHIMPWLPQNSLLAHPNTKVFITHCGSNSQYEALYHGVPMLGIPLLFEQSHNALRAKSHGLGLTLDILTLTSEDLKAAILELVKNENYARNAKRSSEILKDRPMLPKEEVVHWMEHVIKFGSGHLRTSGFKLSQFSYFCLDLILTILVILVVILWIMYKLIKRFSGRNRAKEKLS